ncbi:MULTISPECIES: hypothetical protein [Priestia]|uniref:hypothetical protein n=1 Tax=Priestia TaxID=2800373 RepID=UPI000532D043|nr:MULTISPECIES: hypothetical protein [Priestia]
MQVYKPERLIYTLEHGAYAIDVWRQDESWMATATQVDAASSYASFSIDDDREKAILYAIDGVKEYNDKHN